SNSNQPGCLVPILPLRHGLDGELPGAEHNISGNRTPAVGVNAVVFVFFSVLGVPLAV
ncbi:hypothetical protein L195_g060422, partial [Trifolium pratense]